MVTSHREVLSINVSCFICFNKKMAKIITIPSVSYYYYFFRLNISNKDELKARMVVTTAKTTHKDVAVKNPHYWP